jgi:hypothetical protein
MGDFNLTEDPIDRTPVKLDDIGTTDALRAIRQKLEIVDQWRHDSPNSREFTYRATHNGMQVKSRLDRIYVAKTKTKHTFNWHIGPSTVPTDHWLVAVRFAPKDATHIGSGRWSWLSRFAGTVARSERRSGWLFAVASRTRLATPNSRF